MSYKISIEYTKNPEKAGKLTLTDDSGNVLLSKLPVAVPENMGVYSEKRGLSAREIKENTEFQRISSQGNMGYGAYGRQFDALKNLNLLKSIREGDEPLIVAANPNYHGDRLKADKKMFVVSQEVFNALFDAVRHNDVKFSIERVSMLWFPGKVERATGIESQAELIKGFETIENSMRRQYEAEELSRARLFKESTSRTQGGKSASSFGNKTSAGAQKPATSPANSSVAQPNKVRPQPSSTTRTSYTTYSNNDDIDAFDTMFMYAYPDLAPFYRPNSMLAWAMYFNHQQNEISKQEVLNNLNNISGFESVGNADFKYTPQGYVVHLYDDNQNHIGDMNYDRTTECYRVSSPDGQSSFIQQQNDGSWTGCTQGSDKTDINYNFNNSNDGFIGNWSATPADGVAIVSGISINQDFTSTSTPFETNDLSKTQSNDYQMGSVSADVQPTTNFDSAPQYDSGIDLGNKQDNSWNAAPKYDSAPDIDYGNKMDNDWRNDPPPPPPPPPPPDDTQTWAVSQDSYGRSFGM